MSIETTFNSKVKFLQNNVGRNLNCMYTCLQLEFEHGIDFVVLQEPWMSEDFTFTVRHNSYYCILPENKDLRPRVVIYSRKHSRFQACLRTDLCSDSDLLVIEIQDRQNQLESIQLMNIYNEKSLREDDNRWTVERSLLSLTPFKHSIVCGDFNAHHSWWNSHASSLRAEALVDWCNTHDLELLNLPDRVIFFRKKQETVVESTIDLTFVSPAIQELDPSWYISEDSSGSDHEII
jgi:exonuclease III